MHLGAVFGGVGPQEVSKVAAARSTKQASWFIVFYLHASETRCFSSARENLARAPKCLRGHAWRYRCLVASLGNLRRQRRRSDAHHRYQTSTLGNCDAIRRIHKPGPS